MKQFLRFAGLGIALVLGTLARVVLTLRERRSAARGGAAL